MLALTPSGSSYLTNGPGNRGLDFNNNGDYRNAGIGINRNNNYLSLLMVFSMLHLQVHINGKYGVMMIGVRCG